MKRILGKLRDRNDGEKKVISLVLSAVFTLAIVSLWFGLGKTEAKVEVVQDNSVYESGPLQELKDGLVKVIDSIK